MFLNSSSFLKLKFRGKKCVPDLIFHSHCSKIAKKSVKHYKSAAHRILDYQETDDFTKKSVKHKANGICSCISCWDAKYKRFQEIKKPRRFKKKAWKLQKLDKINRRQLNVSAAANVNKTV